MAARPSDAPSDHSFQTTDPTGFNASHGDTRHPSGGARLFGLLSFGVFVLGGLFFGALFLANARALMQRPTVRVDLPVAGSVPLASLPVLPLAAGPGVTDIRPNPAAVVKTLLPEWRGTERFTILLLGIDRRDDEPMEGTRSDTMMLVSIDPVAKSAALVSLPRDLWVHIPGYGPQRINVAHAFGGPALAKRTVTDGFGVPVQYFARVDFRGFEDLVNALGGVVLDAERPIKDDEYPAENYAYQRIYIAPGPQLLDGPTSLQYARSRHSENDFGRARRQQRLLVAMRDRALQLDMLPRAQQLLEIVVKSMSTDLSPNELLALARLSSEIDRDKIGSLVIDANLAQPFRSQDGADLLLPDTPAIRREIDRVLRTSARPELRARVEILNATPRNDTGTRVAAYLSEQGFNVTRTSSASRRDQASSSVEVLTSNRAAADAIAAALRLPEESVVNTPTRGAVVDVRITLGQDYDGVGAAAVR